MLLKSVSSPIGFFDATFSKDGLMSLTFIGDSPSKYPCDPELQKYVDSFFSKRGLKSLPPIDLQGTDFQLLVWNALCSIPRGRTASYSTIAKKIGSPNAVRAVGTACKLNPIPLFVPCHRVIKQDQTIGQFALGIYLKKYLINMEAI
jgi:O-6-methylguanine DNA methyltransferase